MDLIQLIFATLSTPGEREQREKVTNTEEMQQLLVERSALVFPDLHLTDEEQLQFANILDKEFLVGGDKELQNISFAPDQLAFSQWLKLATSTVKLYRHSFSNNFHHIATHRFMRGVPQIGEQILFASKISHYAVVKRYRCGTSVWTMSKREDIGNLIHHGIELFGDIL